MTFSPTHHVDLLPHMRLLDLIVRYEAMPVLQRGELLGILLQDTKFMINDLQEKSKAHEIHLLEHDLFELLLCIAEDNPGRVKWKRERIVNGLKWAAREKIL